MEEQYDKIRDKEYLQILNYRRSRLRKRQLSRNNITLEEMFKYGLGDYNFDSKTWRYYYTKMYNGELPFELVNYLYDSIIFDPDINIKLNQPKECSLVINNRAIPFLIDVLNKKHFIVIWINYNNKIIDIYDPGQTYVKIQKIVFNNLKKSFPGFTLVYNDDFKVQKVGSNDRLCMWYGICYVLKRYEGYSHNEASKFIYSNINLVQDDIFNLMYKLSQLELWSYKK